MFEAMDPYGEAEIWQAFVPPVPPDDEVGPPEDLDGVDPVLEAAGWDALTEFEDSLEQIRLGELDADGILAEAAGTRQAERRVQAKLVLMAAQWADRHAILARPWTTGKGCERLVRLGGEGTPEVAEFAPAELGAVLAMTDHAAKGLVGDALDLRHRFPLLWASVQAGFVDVWIARKTVQQARGLSRGAAARVDARIADLAGSLSWTRLRKVVDKEILAADPPKAMDDAEQAAARAGVFLDPEPKDGYQGLFINARAGDAQALDKAIEVISRALKILGDNRDPQQRRATAVGIIADPQTALDLIARAERVRQTQRDAAAARRAGDHHAAETIESTLPEGTTCDGRSGNRRPFAFQTAVLYLHLNRETLDRVLARDPFAGAGVVRVEDIGPVILDQVKQWLGHANVVLKPVINLAATQPVDHYETPRRSAEAIRLIRSADYWPNGTSVSTQQENEHTIPYVPMSRGGPQGQTDPLRMGLMTKTHHRLKTFAGWTVNQLSPGAWLFRSPHRYYFLVDQHGTTPLGRL